MDFETIVLNKERNVSLDCYLQPVGDPYTNVDKRPALIICPGGGYTHLAGREAEPIAFLFLRAGFSVFILKYSINEDALWPHPLEDYEAAMALVRGTAAWNINPEKVAVIGFSAGAHLAGAAAILAQNRPNAAILGYGLFLGDDTRHYLPSAPDLVSAVDVKTPPCFVFSAMTDPVVPVRNSIALIAALEAHHVPTEAHLYAWGSHGFSLGDESVLRTDLTVCERASHWTDEVISWVRETWGGLF